MNTLVMWGTSAAFLYSAVVLFAPALLPASARAVYFEAAAVIITLILEHVALNSIHIQRL